MGGALETFPELDALRFLLAGFVRRVEGVDVDADRETALARLAGVHERLRHEAGFPAPFAMAEQVHGNVVTVTRAPGLHAGCDALATDAPGLTLGIYVADCAPVFLADKFGRAIALIHSGRKGTELGIVPAALEKLRTEFGVDAQEVIAVIGPCIRPPHYEVDFAATIRAQLAAAGTGRIHDAGVCTAADSEHYYSYRREKGRTGRMLALMALKTA